MIESFRHKGLKRFYRQDDRSKLPPDMVERIATILAALDQAATVAAMRRPSFRLHQLIPSSLSFYPSSRPSDRA